MNLIVKFTRLNSGSEIYVFTFTLVFVLRIITSDPEVLTSEPRCCGPDQWEAVSLEVGGLIDRTTDYVTLKEIRSVVHYDYRNRRLTVEETVWNGTSNVTFSRTVHIDYNTQLKWTLYDRQCIHQFHTDAMPSPCIPGEAKYLRTKAISDLSADVWFLNDTHGNSYTYTVTSDTCVHLVEMAVSQEGISAFSLTQYDNISMGIADDKVFQLPSSCLLSLDVRLQ
ncbi:uncharacterized protein LOC124280708 [Haliotis rubra]|uniref:uncharacterized protein LOC124280708 n=1 Tax=Haliotis rubra TaxID=36100 RepID=UPI001EE628FE|nr:uncharacterized protein LOC124280708 [Haliotis rubra]